MMRRHALLAAAMLALSLATAPAQTPAEQKPLTIVVGSSAGGGYDTYARVLARHIGRYLPGQPGIIVQNMPGASSLKAVQYLDAAAPKDGSVVTAFNPGLITESLLNPDRIRLRFSELAWIGSITRDLRVCYAWAATGIKTWADLNASKRFNMGAPAPGTSSFINAAVLKNLFGIAVHQVTGYPGSAEQRLAIERGELDGDCGAWSSVPPEWIGNRRVNPLLKLAPVPIPGLAVDVPFIGDLAASPEAKALLDVLIAPDALGRPFVASQQVPADRLAVMRQAFDRTMQDVQFLAEMAKLDLPVSDPVAGAQAEKIIASIYAAPPALVARAQEIVGR
jgi:tripartite-type tricarboxylate transporter receptor subunit TctC